jgi:hypothetical protein
MAEILNKSPVVNLAEPFGVLLKLGEGFRNLGAGAVQVPVVEVVKSDSGLNQTLIVKAERPPSRPPEIFPCLVSLEIASFVKKNYSVLEEVGHRCGPLSH